MVLIGLSCRWAHAAFQSPGAATDRKRPVDWKDCPWVFADRTNGRAYATVLPGVRLSLVSL